MHILTIIAVIALLVTVVAWVLKDGPKKKKLWGVLDDFGSVTKFHHIDYTTSLRTWAQDSLNDEPVLQTWLLDLHEEGLQALGEKISELGVEMDLDLNWLFAPEEAVVPIAQQAYEELVIDYCKLCLKAVEYELDVCNQ